MIKKFCSLKKVMSLLEYSRISLASSKNNKEGVIKIIRVVCKAKLKPGVKVEDYLILAQEVVAEKLRMKRDASCILYMKISKIP